MKFDSEQISHNMLVQNMATLDISIMAQFRIGCAIVEISKEAYYGKLTQNQILFRIAITCLYKICLVWLLLRWLLGKKTSKKKSIFSKLHETSKYHIFRKLIFLSCFKMFIDFFKGLTHISKS